MQRRQRLDRACLLLRTSALTIAEIASSTGFADQAHLTRECRRLLHTTPRRYRRA
jgi:AraC family transcriptional regulator